MNTIENLNAQIKQLKKGPIQVNPSEHRNIEAAKLIPHRAPFLLIDNITMISKDLSSIEGTKVLNPSDPIFEGHFPHKPIYPGVLQVEMAAQLGLCLFNYRKNLENNTEGEISTGLFLKIHHATFLGACAPKDILVVKTKVIDESAYTTILAGQVYCQDELKTITIVEAYIDE